MHTRKKGPLEGWAGGSGEGGCNADETGDKVNCLTDRPLSTEFVSLNLPTRSLTMRLTTAEGEGDKPRVLIINPNSITVRPLRPLPRAT